MKRNTSNSLHNTWRLSSSMSSYRPLSFKNVQKHYRKNDLFVNRMIMIIATLSVFYYVILSQVIGYKCGDWSAEQEQQYQNKRKRLMPLLLTTGIIYTVVFLCSLIYLIKTGSQDDSSGLFGIGVWCLISIIMLWSKKQDDKNIRCYHIIIMYITFIIYFLLLLSFFFGKSSK